MRSSYLLLFRYFCAYFLLHFLSYFVKFRIVVFNAASHSVSATGVFVVEDYYTVKSSGHLTKMLLNITSEHPKIEQNQS
jgi:hypothetical protein